MKDYSATLNVSGSFLKCLTDLGNRIFAVRANMDLFNRMSVITPLSMQGLHCDSLRTKSRILTVLFSLKTPREKNPAACQSCV